MEHIGFSIDSTDAPVCVTREKRDNFVHCTNKLMKRYRLLIREAAMVLGKIGLQSASSWLQRVVLCTARGLEKAIAFNINLWQMLMLVWRYWRTQKQMYAVYYMKPAFPRYQQTSINQTSIAPISPVKPGQWRDSQISVLRENRENSSITSSGHWVCWYLWGKAKSKGCVFRRS